MAEGLSEAVRGGRGEALAALRDFLASQLESAPATAVSPITKQLLEVLRALDEAGEDGDAVDEFTARRQARIAAAEGL